MGVSHYALTDGYPDYLHPDSLFNITKTSASTMANLKALYANRISFAFDFKGPSLITDTACSASLTAFNLAINDLLLGENIKMNFLNI